MFSIRSGSARLPVAPLATLATLAVLATAWAASAHVCARPIVMTMSGGGMAGMAMSGDMPGMDMASGAMPMLQMPGGTVMLCPVVAALIALSTLLGAWAIVTAARDPHRALTALLLVRVLARLPLLRTFGALVGAGGLAVAAIVAVDGHASFSLPLLVTLVLLLAGTSLAAAIGSVAVSRFVLAWCARVLVAIRAAIAQRPGGFRALRRRAARALHAALVAIAFGRGLRAPPLPAH